MPEHHNTFGRVRPALAARRRGSAHSVRALWACDASFKWQPGFIHGQTLHDELGKVTQVPHPVSTSGWR
jgi:hypothetical protein